MACVWVYYDGSENVEVVPGSIRLAGSLHLEFQGDDVFLLTNNFHDCSLCEMCDADV